MFTYDKPEQKKASKNTVQRKDDERSITAPNLTGIPDVMKSRFENLSGFSFDDVRVHYNSDKPEQLQALAYTQGNQVYLGPGQEKHIEHELGHVVQQKQGRVQPSMQLQGVDVNDDAALEREADLMGEAAHYTAFDEQILRDEAVQMKAGGSVVQRVTGYEALETAREHVNELWYLNTFIPAIETEARRKGKTYKEYIGEFTKSQFVEKLRKLNSNFSNEIVYPGKSAGPAAPAKTAPPRIGPHPISLSKSYPNSYCVLGTNILVSRLIVEDATLFNSYESIIKIFIDSCIAGTLVCYRGISANHFSWDTIKATGVVASEGSEDVPTFTIADAVGIDNKTRWLPFSENKFVALSAARKDSSLTVEGGILNGAVIKYEVNSDTPIAWLTAGEVSIRGPIFIDKVTLVINENLSRECDCHKLPYASPYGIPKSFDDKLRQSIKEDERDVLLIKPGGDYDVEKIKSSMLIEIEYELKNIGSFKNNRDIIKSRRQYFDAFISERYTKIIRDGSRLSQCLIDIFKTQNFLWY